MLLLEPLHHQGLHAFFWPKSMTISAFLGDAKHMVSHERLYSLALLQTSFISTTHLSQLIVLHHTFSFFVILCLWAPCYVFISLVSKSNIKDGFHFIQILWCCSILFCDMKQWRKWFLVTCQRWFHLCIQNLNLHWDLFQKMNLLLISNYLCGSTQV